MISILKIIGFSLLDRESFNTNFNFSLKLLLSPIVDLNSSNLGLISIGS